jgi:signal transduction histidine kinase
MKFSIEPNPPAQDPQDFSDPTAAAAIAAALGVKPEAVVVLTPSPLRGRAEPGFRMAIGWHSGSTWRILRADRPTLLTPWHRDTLAAMLIALILLAVPAWLLARAISRPLRLLAETASQARPAAPLGPLPESGPSEVLRLTQAIAAMHGRLSRHGEGRTAMLAAIAHDLGTPLSRIAFWIEQLPDEARIRANADIDEMRAMIGAALRFARDEAGERVDQRIDLGSLLDSLVEDMDVAGTRVTLESGEKAIVRGDPQALRRLFTNLVENAVRYGDKAALSWRVADDTAEILIDDDGPGFDPAQAERLFEPFVRGDPSRNRETGGTGLGLAIVQTIAEAHRGTVSLERRDGGGRVRVRLPLARR